MNFPKLRLLLATGLCVLAPLAADVAATPTSGDSNGSLQHEVDLALQRGAAFLRQAQAADGSWSNPQQPAITGLALLALNPLRSPNEPELAAALGRGFAFVRAQAQPDGGIYRTGLSNYNTAVCTLALLRHGASEDAFLIERARQFLVGQQASQITRPELDGGIGYGPSGVSPKRQHPDLDNTLVSLEALRACELARQTGEKPTGPQLDWDAAIAFVTRCQNLPSSNASSWVSEQPSDRGGFVYYPGFSNAGASDRPDGSKALRSYGTMTYAGLLSLVYAEVPSDDPRVVSAVEWLSAHFTLEENPGLGEQGLFYYYHLMAKALSISKAVHEKGTGAVPEGWARDLALKLVTLQSGDGSWVNRNGRWLEADAVLVSAYCMRALELIRERL